MQNLTELLDLALDGFDQRVEAVTDRQWTRSTTCPPWNVRDLVNHMVWAMRWASWLCSGATVAAAGTRYNGDLLGEDPAAAFTDAARDVRETARRPDLSNRFLTPYGELTAREFLELITAELTVHAWDLARSIGADDRLDPGLVREVSRRYETDRLYGGRPPAESQPTLFQRPLEIPAGTDEQGRLLALVGRAPAGPVAGSSVG
jgi:uncharacterized protein (TIGR03086 family)